MSLVTSEHRWWDSHITSSSGIYFYPFYILLQGNLIYCVQDVDVVALEFVGVFVVVVAVRAIYFEKLAGAALTECL